MALLHIPAYDIRAFCFHRGLKGQYTAEKTKHIFHMIFIILDYFSVG